MRVAIIHYHLKPGGVTRIVESAAEALAAYGVDLCAISGEPYTGGAELKTGVVSGLGYTTEESEYIDPKYLLHELKAEAKELLGGEPDLWHIHNHSLGKNAVLPDLVGLLVREGAAVLLQVHDFAEDGRPGNYQLVGEGIADWKNLYPYGPRVHTAVLNRRDESILSGAGMPAECLHLLPNPVSVPHGAVARPGSEPPKIAGMERLFLYPTRAIRRKNMGEFLCWAALAREGETFATTLAPANPTARPVYERWVALAKELELPAVFELAQAVDLSFPEVMAAAETVVTTSVAEGFGMAFLEPFLFGKTLCGRDLPDITGDFFKAGVRLSGLYDRLDVPLEWIGGAGELRAKIAPSLAASYAAYGRECGPREIAAALAAAVDGERVDFGRLDEDLQARAIRHLRSLSDPASEILPPALVRQDATTAEANRAAIAEHFNLKQYGQRLVGIYGKILSAPASVAGSESLDPARVLDAFLDPARFCLLRT
ncbi:glycosyltransferase family 4 protein [Ruficoccus amylovorans]|uniref:Glycosyltransferase family 4 protein n=1 Tax=Ruficoccus amylovorans TaxID=1804625 RepID=A0A842HC02_9BACT|nr:glycosyltransferase family 4 protein [Ruficoccus amylovorans]MBC2593995.1 glycosyltransferase family 4 protein [Ruficoccus amylovorans]